MKSLPLAARAFVVALLVAPSMAMAATCTSKASGNWGSSSTWTCTSGSTPASGDTVILVSPYTVSLNGNNRTVAALTIEPGATLNDDGQDLRVNGNVVNDGTFGTNGGALVMRGASSTLSGTGTFNDTDVQTDASGISLLASSTMTFTNDAQIRVGRDNQGSFTLDGTITTGSPWTSGERILRVYENSSATINGTISATSAYIRVEQNATLTNNGTVTVKYLDSDGNNSTSVWTQGANSALTLSSGSSWQGTLNASASGNTVTYTSPATPLTPSSSYYNLAGTGVTCPHGFTVLGSDPCVVMGQCFSGTMAGVINTYYPVSAASGTSVTVGTATGNSTALGQGDLVLIMQMQDATLDTSNGASYGSVTSINAGKYEYAKVASISGNTVTLTSSLVNTYTSRAGSDTQTAKKIQLIRVPVYSSATIGAGLTARAFAGTGGVLAFDVTGTLDLNGATVDVSGKGFRGGGGCRWGGDNNTSGLSASDYRRTASTSCPTWSQGTGRASGLKGEGIAGSPRFVFDGSARGNTTVEGYPNGSTGRGAPGNAGGGGTDDDQVHNDENTGGGGGAGYGSGGTGGYAWSNASSDGRGLGGTGVSGSVTQLTLGGGGGAGSSNNGTNDGNGLNSSGVPGGGIIMVRAGSLSGTGTFIANGSDNTLSVGNDGSGGGGGGGAVLVSAGSGLSGLTINAKGGYGGTNNAGGSGAHGPGGGGGGGYVMTTTTPAACTVTGGIAGLTTNTGDGYANTNYGASAGSNGLCTTNSSLATGIVGLALGSGPCVNSLDHVRLDHTGTAVTCLGESVTVNACNSVDSSGTCTANTTGLTGNVLAKNGATTVATVPFTIGSGNSSTTITVPVTTAQTVTFETSGLSATPSASPVWTCWNGSAASCSNVFSDAGFIVSATAGGAEATIPAQTAGTSSATYQLRAVKTDKTTKVCEAALTGANTVDFGYECVNPTTCYGSDLMNVNGGSNTPIARNNNGSSSSTAPVAMTFDANGNAPFTFNYSDVGEVKLHASKVASGSLLAPISGSSNAFVVKPSQLTVSSVTNSASGANPGTTGTGGAAFTAAGESFTVNVQAKTASGTVAFNFGNETAPLPAIKFVDSANNAGKIYSLVVPTANTPTSGVLTTGTSTNGNGSGVTGTIAVTGNSWSEVGAITLMPYLSDYLGGGAVVGAQSSTIGRFSPYQYAVSGTLAQCDATFQYVGQPLTGTLTVTAQNKAGGTTTNYGKGPSLATLAPGELTLGGVAAGLSVDTASPLYSLVFAVGNDFGTLANGTAQITAAVPVRMTGAAAPLVAPITSGLQVTASTDEVTLIASSPVDLLSPTTTAFRSGRLRLSNASGRVTANLALPIQAQYWSGNSWVLNGNDGCTIIPSTAVARSNYLDGNGAAVVAGTAWTTAVGGNVNLVGGNGNLILNAPISTAPSTNRAGSVEVAINLGTGATDQSCRGTHPATTGAGLPWLRSQNGNCAATFDRDPSGRATFGVYSPENRRTIHVREQF